MPGSILIPCDVSAKVILQTTNVSSLAGQPFANDAVLEPGVHLHWALPDALTGAQIVNPDAASQALFPGVPDLWLVVRFNAIVKDATTRTWTAWVVDSQALTATPLASWQPSANPPPNSILTQAGILTPADALGFPGWGSLPQSASYDVASAAYYPATRNRFGFHDALSGVPTGAMVSYSVIGWYSLNQHDPLTMSTDRLATLGSWNLTWDNDAVTTLTTQIAATAATTQPAWASVAIQSASAPAPSAARVQKVKRAAALSDTDVLAQKITVMKDSFAVDPEAVIHAMEELAAPSAIVCHGSVVSVNTSSASGAGVVPGSQIAMQPSIKRALAAVANHGATDRQLDFSEMMLQSLDSQSATTGGVLDLPGAAQALSFQSAPGQSSFYGVITIATPDVVSINQVIAAAGGNWPAIQARSAALISLKRRAINPPARTAQSEWIGQLTTALQSTVATAGKPVDPRFVYVSDTRDAAQPVSLGVTPDGTGPDSAGYWLDTTDTNALGLLYTNTAGADVDFPSASTLHERPGPRWYRPWSPQIVLNGAGRSYRFGCDGRFDPDNQLVCRTTGNTVASISVNSSAALSGAKILASTASLSGAGLPAEAAPLIEETALLDVSNAPLLALQTKAPSAAQCNAALLAFYGSRNATAPANMQAAATGLFSPGQQPSPVAIAQYADPFDPLFVDTKYTYLAQAVSDWQLPDDYVELTVPGSPVNDAGSQQFSERTRVTASLATTLTSTLVTNRTLDSTGVLVTAQAPPPGVTAAQLDALNVISAPLVQFDETLFNAGWRARCGALRLDQLALVDVFGIRRAYPSAGDQSAPPANLVLTPRLPCWSRLNFRLRSAADPTKDADRSNLPVCGFLVPDYLDHSLNVFDSTGTAIGQILSSPPQPGPGTPASLTVWFQPYPWVSTTGDPTTAITDPTVRAFVQALILHGAGTIEQTPNNGPTWIETGLTAMMRIIDTVRATLDPQAQTRDRRVKLTGDPIAIVRAAVWIESASGSDAGTLAQSPTPVTVPPAMPAIPVRIGDITRPDDSVIGIFDVTNGKFAPVSMDAAKNAILSPLTMPNITNQPIAMPVTHPFIEPQSNTITPGGSPLDLVVLADVRGGYYATCGMLPRKKITMPLEFIQPAVNNIEPVFRVGPIPTILTNQGLIEPVMAPPKIEGLTAGFVHAVEDTNKNVTYPSVPVPTAFPLADLPTGTIMVDGGFIRMSPDPPSV